MRGEEVDARVAGIPAVGRRSDQRVIANRSAICPGPRTTVSSSGLYSGPFVARTRSGTPAGSRISHDPSM